MPSFHLSDVARVRFEDLSFFLVLFLLCALGIKWLWNLLARDFPRLPRIRFGRALALTTLLGVFSLLILSMISGARELLTPNAWRRQGSTYRINDPANDPIRRKGLEILRAALWSYAGAHAGQFPTQDFAEEIADDLWKAPDANQTRYIYFGGQSKTPPRSLLVIEPIVFGESRFVLFTDGEIAKMTPADIRKEVPGLESP
jgi:hypothetical protein